MLRYTGKVWETEETYLVEQNDEVQTIARRYLDVNDDKILSDAAWTIRVDNGLEMQRYRTIKAELHASIPDSTLAKKKKTDSSFAREIISLPQSDRTAAKIYVSLTEFVDTGKADKLADQIMTLLSKPDRELKDLVEIRVPFTIAIHDSVTAMVVDEQERLWVGTPMACGGAANRSGRESQPPTVCRRTISPPFRSALPAI